MSPEIEVLFEGRKLTHVMKPEEVGNYLFARRLKLVGGRIIDLAKALGIRKNQASDLLHGRIPFGSRMISRLNELDPEYELVELIGVVRKTGKPSVETLVSVENFYKMVDGDLEDDGDL